MDITPVYELKARLRAVMIAGTNLLAEDFRLKRAAEAMKPLEAASPVFARIGDLVRRLLAPETEDKEGLLLEAITLVDALLCTQGEVAVAEELTPITLENTGGVMNNAPYSDLKAIVDALTNSGGGRYSYLTEMHGRKPELFNDYRIKPALVQALGASYAELADDVQGWLTDMGGSVLPLLKKGFNPKGKKEMVRRVEVIEAIAGADANEFYKAQLPEAEKEVRQALIYALRHNQENEELLQTLTKTEKGNAKKMAYCALACMEGDGGREYVAELVEKRPVDAYPALCVSGTDWAADMVRQKIFGLLDKLEKETEGGYKVQNADTAVQDLNSLGHYLFALNGKNGRTVGDCCRRVAAFAEKPQIMKLLMDGYTDRRGNIDHTLKRQLAKHLREYLASCPDEEMVSLALELYENYGNTQAGEAYFPTALLAKLISCEDCTPWLQKELDKGRNVEEMPNALDGLRWSSGRKAWVMETTMYSQVLEKRHNFVCPLKQRIDGDFLALLIGLMDGKPYHKWDSALERVIANCIPDNDKAYEDAVMGYFYRKAVSGEESGSIYYYCSQLKEHGYPECKGIATQYFQKKQQVYMWEITNMINALPGTDEVKRAEAQAVLELVKSESFKKRIRDLNTTNMERLESLVLSI